MRFFLSSERGEFWLPRRMFRAPFHAVKIMFGALVIFVFEVSRHRQLKRDDSNVSGDCKRQNFPVFGTKMPQLTRSLIGLVP